MIRRVFGRVAANVCAETLARLALQLACTRVSSDRPYFWLPASSNVHGPRERQLGQLQSNTDIAETRSIAFDQKKKGKKKEKKSVKLSVISKGPESPDNEKKTQQHKTRNAINKIKQKSNQKEKKGKRITTLCSPETLLFTQYAKIQKRDRRRNLINNNSRLW